jgi:hypothetical protein
MVDWRLLAQAFLVSIANIAGDLKYSAYAFFVFAYM